MFCVALCDGVLGDVNIVPSGFNRFKKQQSARARKEATEGASGGALAPLVLPAKSLGRFLAELSIKILSIQIYKQ